MDGAWNTIHSTADGQPEAVITVHTEADRACRQLQESGEFHSEVIPAARSSRFRVIWNVHGWRVVHGEIIRCVSAAAIDALFVQIDVSVNIVDEVTIGGVRGGSIRGCERLAGHWIDRFSGDESFRAMHLVHGKAGVSLHYVHFHPWDIHINEPGRSHHISGDGLSGGQLQAANHRQTRKNRFEGG